MVDIRVDFRAKGDEQLRGCELAVSCSACEGREVTLLCGLERFVKTVDLGGCIDWSAEGHE